MTATNDQKTPLAKNLGDWLRTQQGSAAQLLGQALPASVQEVNENGTIVKVKFEIYDPVLQLPQVEMPVATDKYARSPLKKGDPGYCIPGTVYLGGVSGLGGGTATFDQLPNLSTLVFHPLGNTDLPALFDKDKFQVTADKAMVVMQGTDVLVDMGKTDGGDKNVMRLPTLINATNDADAASKGVPLMGMYHNNGGVKVRIT